MTKTEAIPLISSSIVKTPRKTLINFHIQDFLITTTSTDYSIYDIEYTIYIARSQSCYYLSTGFKCMVFPH